MGGTETTRESRLSDPRPILLVIGILLTTLGIAMLLPAAVDLSVGNTDWQVFLNSSLATTFIGVALWLANRGYRGDLNMQQAFILTTLSWVALVTFAALPFALSPSMNMTYTDAFFEAMSGLTTTGSTVIVGLDQAPPGILAWRALLQWLGGVGIIVMAIAVLPMLRIGGMQIFKLESSDTSEKILPRAQAIVGSIVALYVGLTAICAFSYWYFGMPFAHAVAHSMTTIATGGFSTSDLSLGRWDLPGIQYTSVLFMVLASLPFALYLQALAGKPRVLWRDAQVRGFFMVVIIITAVLVTYLTVTNLLTGEAALRAAMFNGISILTGTGYATHDYHAWGTFAVGIFFFTIFIGGCAGSTSCGIKIFRFQVIEAAARTHVQRIVHPHGVFTARYNGRPVPGEVISSVMSFLFLFLSLFALMAVALSLLGLDSITAWSASATALANVGPGLGPVVGPAGSFESLPIAAKWILAGGMLLGRLELFTVLVLFLPSFWRH